MAIQIPRAVLDAIAAHALAALPDECCGLLIGDRTVVTRALATRNAHAAPATRFLVDPRDQFEALRSARHEGREVVGAYHSHPRGPAIPSETDRAEAHDPALIHLIVDVSTGIPVIRAFSLDSGNFRSLDLVPVP